MHRQAHVKVGLSDIMSGCSGIHKALSCALVDCPYCLTWTELTSKLVDLKALPSLRVHMPIPDSLIHVMAKFGNVPSPSVKTWFTWHEPQRGGRSRQDPITATWRMQAFGVCHRLGTGTEWFRLVAKALLKLAFLWRKNHFKPVVIIILKQVSAKWVTESSSDSSPWFIFRKPHCKQLLEQSQ